MDATTPPTHTQEHALHFTSWRISCCFLLHFSAKKKRDPRRSRREIHKFLIYILAPKSQIESTLYSVYTFCFLTGLRIHCPFF